MKYLSDLEGPALYQPTWWGIPKIKLPGSAKLYGERTGYYDTTLFSFMGLRVLWHRSGEW